MSFTGRMIRNSFGFTVALPCFGRPDLGLPAVTIHEHASDQLVNRETNLQGPAHDSTQVSVTSSFLLEGLKDPANLAVWTQYVNRYRPMLLAYAQRLGLPPADGEDAAQQILTEFCRAYQAGKYDRDRGRLREWLFGIARNQIMNLRRRRATRPEVQIADSTNGTGFLERAADDEQLTSVWDDEWQNAILRDCLTAVRREVEPKTFEAFELFACSGLPAAQVAQQLNMTENAVFGAKRRVLRRARELLANIQHEW